MNSPTDHGIAEEADQNNVSEYQRTGLHALPGLLGGDVVDLVVGYLNLLGHIGGFTNEEHQVKDALARYGDPLVDSLMASLCPVVSGIVGSEVVPTYSFVRVYFEGQELVPHRDRRACEHSLTVHLAAESSESWPLRFVDLEGVQRNLLNEAGDAVLYAGCDLTHSRVGGCPTSWYMQAFLHYVEAAGPNAHEVLDRRANLGTRSVR